MLHMKGNLIRVEKMLAELKKYGETLFENSRLVDVIVKDKVPATHYAPKKSNSKYSTLLNEVQREAINKAVSVT